MNEQIDWDDQDEASERLPVLSTTEEAKLEPVVFEPPVVLLDDDTPVENVDDKPVKTRKPRKSKIPKTDSINESDLTKVKKPKKIKAPELTPRETLKAKLDELSIDSIILPWMKLKAFRLVTDVDELERWCEERLVDQSNWHPCPQTLERMPAIAVDTETIGLDTRIVDGEIGIQIAGMCLSSDGVEGLYIPMHHEDGNNIDVARAIPLLQRLFDRSLLLFYNGKFDREVLRITLGIQCRRYPYFEDVQILKYLVDPKADLEDKKGKGKRGAEYGGLKSLSLNELGIHQLELDTLARIKVKVTLPNGKTSNRSYLAPFTWIPTDIALWYAAGDAICTWLLWERFRDRAREIKLPHKVDHCLLDALTWMERQRFMIGVERLHHDSEWQHGYIENLVVKLRELADYGDEFNPNSPDQLSAVLFGKFGMKPKKVSKKTEKPSVDAEVIAELIEDHPDSEFLKVYQEMKEYTALHPSNLKYDPRDHSAKISLRQTTVAGGRLSANGGDFDLDGGFGLNIHAIKRVEGNWWVYGRRITTPIIDWDGVVAYTPQELTPKATKKDKDTGVITVAPNIIKNHIGTYFGDQFCLVPNCKCCSTTEPVEYASEKPQRVDANQILNLRALFVAKPGYTIFTIDYSNIEMRVAANVSGEHKFIYEFLEGSGDFHTLTATNVFPEFSDPNTSKDRRKELRSLAKIINFALLYGGTEYTIFTNMSKEDPNITKKAAAEMVRAYWESVPQFKAWVEKQQSRAKDTMTCRTPSGRIVKFDSQMRDYKIYVPNKHEWDNAKDYWRYKKEARVAEELGEDLDYARGMKKKADALYANKDTGVANVVEYGRFIGKIQRVSMNIPMQGFAGDEMRMALVKIFEWAQASGVENVVELHSTVHDEIDFSVKNEYVPYVIPRVTRLMKLRKLHKNMKWLVPIECDAEYGDSWDVQHHMTGDDKHPAAAWTEISGVENYLPPCFPVESYEKLVRLTLKGKKDIAVNWLEENTNPRVMGLISDLAKSETAKSEDQIRKSILVILQLSEYWDIDQAEDDPLEETLSAYEARCGLTGKRPQLPAGGKLGVLPYGTVPIRYPAEAAFLLGSPIESPKIEVTTQVVDTPTEVKEPDQYTWVDQEPQPVEAQEEPAVIVVDHLTAKELEEYTILDIIPTDVIIASLVNRLGIGTNSVKVHFPSMPDHGFIIPKISNTEIPVEFRPRR